MKMPPCPECGSAMALLSNFVTSGGKKVRTLPEEWQCERLHKWEALYDPGDLAAAPAVGARADPTRR